MKRKLVFVTAALALGLVVASVVPSPGLGLGAASVGLYEPPASEVQKNLQLFPEKKYPNDYRSYPEDRFKLDDLPAYQPKQRVTGYIKIAGTGALEQGKLAKLWEEDFKKFHPDVKFSFYLPGKEIAVTPLYYHQADISVVEELGFYDELETAASLITQQRRALAIAERGKRRMYPADQFDLSDLPPYKPKAILDGWIRIHGNNYLETGPLGKYWEEEFKKHQPNIKISWYLPTRAVGLSSLYYDQADLLASLGSDFGLSESVAYQKVMGGRQPFGIESFTGSFDLPGWANTPVIIVNKNNPLSKISIEELDGIFGAERNGGWQDGVWHPEYKRGPEKNIRTWGQLGLTGKWADKPINVYGFQIRYNTASNFQQRVLQGSDKWNENFKSTGNYALPDGSRVTGGDFISRSVEADPYGIAFTNYGEEYIRPGVKVLALGEKKGGPYAEFTIENARNRTYPWVSTGAFYMNETPGAPMNPLVKEFLSFILSREGQEAVVRDGKYLPLPADVIAREREKLEIGWGDEPYQGEAKSSDLLKDSKIKLVINGEEQTVEQPPVYFTGRTLMPLRPTFEKLGAKVTWNQKERLVTVVKGSTKIELKIGSDKYLLNGTEKPLGAKSLLINDNLMVPLSFISETLGVNVTGDANSVNISPK